MCLTLSFAINSPVCLRYKFSSVNSNMNSPVCLRYKFSSVSSNISFQGSVIRDPSTAPVGVRCESERLTRMPDFSTQGYTELEKYILQNHRNTFNQRNECQTSDLSFFKPWESQQNWFGCC